MSLTTVPGVSTGDTLTEAMWDTYLADNLNGLIELALQGNLLVNPGFEVWQRGGGAFVENGAYTADRWQINLSGTSSISVTRSGSDTADPLILGSLYRLDASYTHNAGSELRQKIEDVAQLKGRKITFAAPVFANAINAVRLRIYTTGASQNVDTYSSYHSGDGSYNPLTVTVTVPVDATELYVSIFLTASVTLRIDNAVLVIGATAPRYAPRQTADDLARCQRYYELVSGELMAYASGAGQDMGYHVPFKVTKAADPTVTKQGTWGVLNCGQPSAVSRIGAQRLGVTLYAVSSAAGAVKWYPDTSDDVFIVEANP